MLTKKVIAAEITNLTDARYFAARGVDYLLFDLGQISLTQILEIKEWVEGPEVLIVLNRTTLPFLDECVIKVAPYAIGSRDEKVAKELSFMSAHVNLFDWSDSELIILEDELFKILKSKGELDQLGEGEGIILSGGEEDAIGLKNFESIDEVLDLLESY